MADTVNNNIILQFLSEHKRLGLFNILSTLLILAFGLLVAFYFKADIYVLLAIVSLIYVFFLLHYPKIWLYSLAIMTAVFFHSHSEGLTILDTLSAAFFVGSIALWFINHTLLKRQKTAYNLGDWLILAFFFFLILNVFVAFFNNGELMLWLREYLMFSIILIYFPIRDVIKSENDLKKFLIFYCFIVMGSGIYQIFLYTQVNALAVYAYELNHGININQTLYTTASIFGFVFTLYQIRKKNEILTLLFTSIAIISLIATFSRTFWITLIAVYFILFMFFSFGKKIKIISYFLLIIGTFVLVVYMMIGDNLFLFVQIVASRFTSSADGAKDLSVIARLLEWEQVLRQIMLHPLAGVGLGKKFSFYFVITGNTAHTNVIHNAYLFIIYRVGFPLVIFYFSFLVFYTVKAYNNLLLALKSNSQFYKALAISNLTSILTFFVVNFTSSQLFYRDGLFITAFLASFIYLNEKFLKNNISLNNPISLPKEGISQ